MNVNNYYEILGCQINSTQEDIKRAYHARALKFHPDKNNMPGIDKSVFQSILQAWKVLGNPESRKQYDVTCKQEELEAESSLVYARISPLELQESNDDKNILTYLCRCGSNYYVEKDDIYEKNCTIHVPCEECTFVIAIDT